MTDQTQSVSEKKVYSVHVDLSFNMAVVAASKEEAEEIAEDRFEEELENVRADTAFFARELNECPKEFKGTLPYGTESDEERESWPVEKWMAGA